MYRGKVTKVDTKGVYVQTAEFGTLGPCQAVVANYAVGDMVLCDNVGDDGSPDLIVVGKLTATGSVGGGLTLPVSSTDNAIVRWDGTSGTALQNSGVTVDDNNNVIMSTASGVNATFEIRAAEAGRNAGVTIRTGTSRRWAINKDATGESGSNVGSDLQISRYDDSDTGLGSVIKLTRSNGRVQITNVGSAAGLEFGANGPRMMVGTGGPSGISAPVGSTWRQTDANTSHGSLTGLLWTKVGTGTTEGTDWLVDFEGRWVDWTPTLTGISLGTGSTTRAKYTRRGKLISASCSLTFGASGTRSVSDPAKISLPFQPADGAEKHVPVLARPTSSIYSPAMGWSYGGTADLQLFVLPASSTYLGGAVAALSALSATWDAGAALSFHYTYEIA